MKIKTLIALCAAGLLGGCVTPHPDDWGPYPSDYKGIIKAYVIQTYFDPHSMRDVEISPWPQGGHILFTQGWIVCLQANAKNRLGGYVGLQRTAYLIKNGAVIDALEHAAMCDNVALEPWPEMEGH